MESRKIEILMEEILKAIKRTDNKFEKIKEKNKQIRKEDDKYRNTAKILLLVLGKTQNMLDEQLEK